MPAIIFLCIHWLQIIQHQASFLWLNSEVCVHLKVQLVDSFESKTQKVADGKLAWLICLSCCFFTLFLRLFFFFLLYSHCGQAVVSLPSCLTVFSLHFFTPLSFSLFIHHLFKGRNKTESLSPSGPVVACHLVPWTPASPGPPSVPFFVTEVPLRGIASGTQPSIYPSVHPSSPKRKLRDSRREKRVPKRPVPTDWLALAVT